MKASRSKCMTYACTRSRAWEHDQTSPVQVEPSSPCLGSSMPHTESSEIGRIMCWAVHVAIQQIKLATFSVIHFYLINPFVNVAVTHPHQVEPGVAHPLPQSHCRPPSIIHSPLGRSLPLRHLSTSMALSEPSI